MTIMALQHYDIQWTNEKCLVVICMGVEYCHKSRVQIKHPRTHIKNPRTLFFFPEHFSMHWRALFLSRISALWRNIVA